MYPHKTRGVFYGFCWLDSFSHGLDLICLLVPLRFVANQSLKINPYTVPVTLTISKKKYFFYSETNPRYQIFCIFLALSNFSEGFIHIHLFFWRTKL